MTAFIAIHYNYDLDDKAQILDWGFTESDTPMQAREVAEDHWKTPYTGRAAEVYGASEGLAHIAKHKAGHLLDATLPASPMAKYTVITVRLLVRNENLEGGMIPFCSRIPLLTDFEVVDTKPYTTTEYCQGDFYEQLPSS